MKRDAQTYTIFLPYLGAASDRFRFRIKRFCNRYSLNVKVSFTSFRVGKYFTLKSRVPTLLQSCVVYKYTCPVDQVAYIGKTKRHLIDRVKEHSSTHTSAIFNHNISCQCFHPQNFEILKSSKSDFDLSLHEALSIKKFNPALNT